MEGAGSPMPAGGIAGALAAAGASAAKTALKSTEEDSRAGGKIAGAIAVAGASAAAPAMMSFDEEDAGASVAGTSGAGASVAGSSGAGASAGAEEPPAAPLDLGELEATLRDEMLLAEFRKALRILDKKADSAPEIKGRFERCLDFVLACSALDSLPESQSDERRRRLLNIRADFFDCPPGQKLAVASGLARADLVKHMLDVDKGGVKVKVQLIRPVFNEIYRKVQQKHDLWRANYKPPTTRLQALLCSLS